MQFDIEIGTALAGVASIAAALGGACWSVASGMTANTRRLMAEQDKRHVDALDKTEKRFEQDIRDIWNSRTEDLKGQTEFRETVLTRLADVLPRKEFHESISQMERRLQTYITTNRKDY